MAYGIFEQLAWLTKKVKTLCCIVENGGSGCSDCPVTTDGITITGDGTVADPLIAVAPTAPYTTLVLGNVTQFSTSDPTFNILENTTGETYTFTRNSAGDYSITASTGTPFTTGRVAVLISNGDNPSVIIGSTLRYGFSSSTELKIYSYKPGALNDSTLADATIEIKIYP